jgi:predicted AAA+ superfamily ATPase
MYHEKFADFYYWHLAGGTEVDFIVNDMMIAIEVKAAQKISDKHLKGLRSLKEDHPEILRRVIVCCENKPRTTTDGIEVIPAEIFAQKLWDQEFF